jgi:hypothetical protein
MMPMHVRCMGKYEHFGRLYTRYNYNCGWILGLETSIYKINLKLVISSVDARNADILV